MTVSERSFFSPLSLSLERWELDVGGEESRTWESTFKFRIAAPFFLSTFHFRCCRCLLRFVVVVFFSLLRRSSFRLGGKTNNTNDRCVCVLCRGTKKNNADKSFENETAFTFVSGFLFPFFLVIFSFPTAGADSPHPVRFFSSRLVLHGRIKQVKTGCNCSPVRRRKSKNEPDILGRRAFLLRIDSTRFFFVLGFIICVDSGLSLFEK